MTCGRDGYFPLRIRRERVDDVLARQTLGVPLTEDHSQVLQKLHRTTIGFGHGVREFQCGPARPFRPVPANRFGNGTGGTFILGPRDENGQMPM